MLGKPTYSVTRKSASMAWLSACSLGLMAIVPFLNPHHPPPTTSFYSEWLTFALGLAALAPMISARFWSPLHVPTTAVWLFALIVLAVVQIAFIDPPYAAQYLRPIVYLGWAAALVCVTVWLRDVLGETKLADVFALFVLAGTVLHALIAVIQYLGLPGPFAGFIAVQISPAIYGNLGQQNHLASHLTLGVVALGYLHARGLFSRPTAMGIIPLFAFTTAVTTSRAVLLYCAALLALSALAAIKKRNPATKRYLAVSAAMCTWYLVFLFAMPSIHNWLANSPVADWSTNPWTFSQIAVAKKLDLELVSSGVDIRLSEWHKGLLMVLQSPIIGIGPENYGWQSFALQGTPTFVATPRSIWFAHSHNLFVQVLVDYGLAGLLILAALLIAWTRRFKESWHTTTGLFVALSLSVLFIHANLELPLWYAYFLGPAVIFLGLGEHRPLTIAVNTRIARPISALTLVIGIAVLANSALAYRSIEQLIEHYAERNPDGAKILARAARNPIVRPDAEIALTYFIAVDEDAINQKLAVFRRVVHYRPDWYWTYRYAALLAVAGETQHASALLRHSSMVFPLYLNAFIDQLPKNGNRAFNAFREEAVQISIKRACSR